MALLVTLRDLIEMMSIGTLLAYTLVSMCVLILRYQPHVEVKTALGDYDTLDEDGEGWGSSQVPSRDHEPSSSSEAQATLHEAGVDKLLPKLQTDGSHTEKSFYGALDDDTDRFFNYSQSDLMRSRAREWIYGNLEEARIKLGLPASTEFPTAASGRSVTISVFTLFVLIFMLCFVVVVFNESLGQLWIVIFMSVVITLIAGLIINIIRLPQNPEKLKFMAPGLPYLPLIAMFINIFLMLKLNKLTWVRFAIWMSIGLLIYFGYGMWNSSIEGRTNYNRRRSNTGKDKMVVDNNKVQMEVEASVIPAHVKKEDEKSPEESSGFETE